ncbi:SagB family peptide dehydrogenase [Streptomyces sp. NBC_00433]
MTSAPPKPLAAESQAVHPAAATNLTLRHSLPDGVTLAAADGRLFLRTDTASAPLGSADPVLAEALTRFASGLDRTAAEESLLDDPDPVLCAHRLARFNRLAGALSGLLRRHLDLGGTELLQAAPMTGAAPAAPADLADSTLVRLSRGAFLHAVGGRTVVDSAFTTSAVVLTDPRATALLGALATAAPLARHAADQTLLPEPAARDLVRWLAAYGLVVAADEEEPGGGRFAEDTGVLGQWSPVDLLMHTRSRLGWQNTPYGATFRLLGEVEPQPAVRPPHTGRTVALYRPAELRLAPDEPRFSEILEARQSIRSYGPAGPTVRRLGEFLFRTARTRARFGPYPERQMPYEAADRPSPSGGGSQDLEVYVTAHRVEGLERAVYHYDAWRHVLVEVCAEAATVDAMLAAATRSKGGETPDAVVTVTSRFSRLAWKYERIAYATTLRNVGALYQTFYLVATAMGLAPCGLGGGDSALVARAIGVDPFEEGAVGDFALGSLPTGALLDAERDRAASGDPRWQGGQAPEWCQVRRTVIAAPDASGTA